MNNKLLAWMLSSLGAAILLAGLLVYLFSDGMLGMRSADVRLRLKWVHQGQFAGFYVAFQNGYYANAGLNVTISPGGQDMNAIRNVTSGSDDIGVWGAEQLLIARSKGFPVRAIGVVYQDTAACFVARADSGITSFNHIENKTVGTQRGTDLETIYRALVALNNVDRSKVKEINVSYDFQRFLAGEVDVWPSYAVNEPYIATARGVPIRIIHPRDNGLHFYGDTIFCTEQFARDNADVVRKFMEATAKGWRYALEHPEEAAEICLTFDQLLDPKHQLHMIRTSKPLIWPEGTDIMRMTDERWLEIHEVLKQQELISQDVPLSEIYTNEFIPN